MPSLYDFRHTIEQTADGSATIYLPELDEHYHSVKGALTESNHIFRDCALRHHSAQRVRVLEIGFGTGLNAAVTAEEPSKEFIDYFTLELYPLGVDEIHNLGYDNLLNDYGKELYAKIIGARWDEPVEIAPHFVINKLQMDFTDFSTPLPQGIDVVYFDAFAPEKQPEMWSVECIKRVYDAMNVGGILTTYCSKGEIRRRLQSVGFEVERIPGPPGGKREILRATKL